MVKYMTDPSAESRRRGAGVGMAAMPAFVLLLTSLASAGPPEVVRVRIPAAKVAGWFPAGTELRMMSVDGFDSLLESARRGADGPGAAGQARLIRARHQARWKEGTLEGRSELVVDV